MGNLTMEVVMETILQIILLPFRLLGKALGGILDEF